MKVKILTLAAGISEILTKKLENMGIQVETVDYSKPFLPQLKDASILINGLGRVDKLVIDAAPELKLIHQIGTGTDTVDLDYCLSKSIYVANIPKNNSIAVSEHTIFLMIHLAKNMKSASGGLMNRRVLNVLGTQLNKKNLLIMGYGYTGSEVAKRAKAFDMNVTVITKNPANHKFDSKYVSNFGGLEKLEELIRDADFISIHAPLTPDTKGMFGMRQLSMMKETAYLINVARAQIVDKKALYDILSSKKIAGAAFDVFWEEPADPNDEILKLDNFVLTPHIAGWTAESISEVAKIIMKNIELLRDGKVPQTIVEKK